MPIDPISYKAASELGFETYALEQAIAFAQRHESSMNRDIGAALEQGHFEEPWPIGQTLGPVKKRKDPSGVIMRHGKIAAHWGDVSRVDMTFSVSKSYLALLAGLAVDDGLIPDIDAPVADLVRDGGFDSVQNRTITWMQLLQLTSEWQGTLWDKPDWIDHNRSVMGETHSGIKGQKRILKKPGTYWEYNDVRVNQLALSLLHVFRQPLPDVLRTRIMDPIGASQTWQWHGYDNSYVEIDGTRMQSVSGGAHWGGGLWISTLDQARTGQLIANGGKWGGRRLISKTWLDRCKRPCELNESYGFLWWLNTRRTIYKSASETSVFAIGVGTNLIWIDPKFDLVVVARWIDADSVDQFMHLVLAALR